MSKLRWLYLVSFGMIRFHNTSLYCRYWAYGDTVQSELLTLRMLVLHT
jgi:hypothetical protein